jgi:predicted Zn-dependent protease
MKSSSADQTELVFEGESLGYTHIAESQIQQNLTRSDCSIVARVIVGKRIGIASTNRPTVEDVKQVISDAIDISSFQDPDDKFVSLPNSPRAKDVGAFFPSTADFSPVDRANSISRARKQNCR